VLNTFTVDAAVELAVVERGGFIESRHAGSAIVLAPDGTVRARLGDPDAVILPRSSLKPLQAVGMLTAGAVLEGEHLGLATASHSGTDAHVRVVREILAIAGLEEAALECPPSAPGDGSTRDEAIRAGAAPVAVRHNCSGKHAAMLLTCTANGWSPVGYADPAHPLQVHLREVIERLTGEKVRASVIDGCGAPVHAITLSGLARGIQRVGTSSERSPFALHRHAGAVRRAVLAHPWTIAGPGWSDTVLAERAGIFAKLGAEGVQVAAAPDGTIVALKMLDGSPRAAAIVAVRLLIEAGALDASVEPAVAPALHLDVPGGAGIVGAVRPTATIR
jgi:L-asparaginase II